MSTTITALFVDVGGVLLTNGWDRQSRQQAADIFDLDYAEMDERHHLTFDTYEEGKLSLEEYLNRVIFYQPRPFPGEVFREFMFAQSQPYPEILELVHDLKTRYGLKVVVISNEGRELMLYRIRKFNLSAFVDCFVASSFVHYRKPDPDIYRIALDLAQVAPAQAVYLEDRAMFVEVAQNLGIRGICHTGYQATRQALVGLGLS